MTTRHLATAAPYEHGTWRPQRRTTTAPDHHGTGPPQHRTTTAPHPEHL
ncbi:hypothetical protein OHB13_26600 [Streptomyces sp. NBC_00440]